MWFSFHPPSHLLERRNLHAILVSGGRSGFYRGSMEHVRYQSFYLNHTLSFTSTSLYDVSIMYVVSSLCCFFITAIYRYCYGSTNHCGWYSSFLYHYLQPISPGPSCSLQRVPSSSFEKSFRDGSVDFICY